MIKFLVIPLLCSCISAPLMNSYKEENHYLTPVRECVSYDETTSNIYLSSEEIGNYVFGNLNSYFAEQNENISNWIDPIRLNDINYEGTDTDSYGNYYYEYIDLQSHIYRIYFLTDAEGFNSDWDSDFSNYQFVYASINEILDFEYECRLSISSDFNDIKQAIELDIQANQTSVMPSISDLFQQVTSAITAFVGSMGQAFTSITALFWTTGENAGPTFLGLLVLIGVGVGLVYGAYRVIKGLLHRI